MLLPRFHLHVRLRPCGHGSRPLQTAAKRCRPRARGSWLAAPLLLLAASAPLAQPLAERDFIRMAAERDQVLGTPLHEDGGAIITSSRFGAAAGGCSAQAHRLPAHTEATQALLRRQTGQAAPPPADSPQARHAAEMAAYNAEVASLREARAAWTAAFRQVKPAYDREWEAAHQAHRLALQSARTPEARRQLESEWHRTWDAMRERHFGPLGPEPVVARPPPQPPAGLPAAEQPALELPAVQATLLRIGLGLHDPLVPVGGPGAADWRDSAPVRDWLARLVPLLDAACPQVELLVLSLGFYDVLGPGASALPQQIHFLKIDGRWRPELLHPPGPSTKAELLRSARPRARAGEQPAGPVLSWLEQDGYDHAFGRFFEARPREFAALPGIEWRDRAHWTRFEDEAHRPLIERGVGGPDLRRFEAARVVFAGAFDIVPQTPVLWDSYLGLLDAYEKTCPAQLAQDDPVVRVVRVTSTHPQTHVRSTTETRRTLPRRHLNAFEKARGQYSLVAIGAVLGGSPSGMVGQALAMEQRSLERQQAARRFLQTEGCGSAATRQLLENFARAVLGEPSLQRERAGARR